jgi:integrase
LADFAGATGADLVVGYIRSESGGKDRGLRERFSGPGNLSRLLTYSVIRQRLNTLRHVLERAVFVGALECMPEPWPIPRPGSHGHVNRGRYLLKVELEAVLERQPPKHRNPLASSKSSAPIVPPPAGGETLGHALDWLLKYGFRRITKATATMHTEHVHRLKAFFGVDRPLADFRGCSGYRLLMEFVEKEGPDEGGRGIKFVTVKKYLNTLAMTLREATKRGDLDAMPPWPELPNDSQPRERYLTYDEYRKIRALVAPPWHVWIDIGVWTGQHSSDISSMTWAMVDLGAGPGNGPGPGAAFWLRRNTKNQVRPLWLPMPDELRASLTAAYQQDRPDSPDRCITGPDHNVRKYLRRVCRKLGIAHVAPIDLRRTCATWILEKGGPKDAIRRWLGHSQTSAMVEKHYAQVTVDMVGGIVDALNRAARDPGSAGTGTQYVGPRLLQAVEERGSVLKPSTNSLG